MEVRTTMDTINTKKTSRFKQSSFAELARLVWQDKLSRIAVFVIGIVVFMALLSFFWTPHDPFTNQVALRRQGPSWSSWFGTDLVGRDLFSRVMYASRITVILTFITIVAGGLPFSIGLGVFPIFYSKKADFAVQRTGEALGALPALFLILILRAGLRPMYDNFVYTLGPAGRWAIKTGMADLFVIFLIISFISWIGPARMFRAQVLQMRESAFVERARMLGASKFRIVSRHILPQLYTYIVHSALLMIVGVVGTELALSFLGIGIQLPYPSFGGLLAESANSRMLSSAAHLLIFPGLVIFSYIFAFLFLELRLTLLTSSEHEREVLQ